MIGIHDNMDETNLVTQYGAPLEYYSQYQGPTSKRSPTNILFLIIFVVVLAGWVGIGIYAMNNGDMNDLKHREYVHGKQHEINRRHLTRTGHLPRTRQSPIDFTVAYWYTILVVVLASAVASLIYILLLRWKAIVVIFGTVTAIGCFVAYLIYWCYHMYQKSPSKSWIVSAVVLGIALIFMVFMMIYLRKRILLACELIREASNAVFACVTVLVFPIIPWILDLIVVVFGGYTAIMLLTLLPEEEFETSSPKNSSDTRQIVNYVLQAYNGITCIWVICFISGIHHMTLAGHFATWYWTFDKSNVTSGTLAVSFWRTIRYHLGTVAVGSLVLTICNLIRIIVRMLHAAERDAKNPIVKILLICLSTLLSALAKFLKMVTENAFIICAIHGDNFCTSARRAFDLIIRNIEQVFVMTTMTDWLLFMGKVTITAIATYFNYWWISHDLTDDVKDLAILPTVCAGFGCYIVVSIVFEIYAAAINTIFICFLEDIERNDGTPEKPYYMSRGTMKALRKTEE